MLYFGIGFIIVGLSNAYLDYRYYKIPRHAEEIKKGWPAVRYIQVWFIYIIIIGVGIALIIKSLLN